MPDRCLDDKAGSGANLLRHLYRHDRAHLANQPVTLASDFSVGSSSQGRLRSAFSGQDSRHHRLHQTAGVATAIAAHQPADGVTGSVEAMNRLVAFIQNLRASVHQNAAHGESDPGNDSQTVEWRAQRPRLAGARDV